MPLEVEIQYLEPRIQSVKVRIQDCLGFPYKGRIIPQINLLLSLSLSLSVRELRVGKMLTIYM